MAVVVVGVVVDAHDASPPGPELAIGEGRGTRTCKKRPHDCVAGGTPPVLEERRAIATFRRPVIFKRKNRADEAETGGYYDLNHAAGQRCAFPPEQDLIPLREEGPHRRRLGVAGEVPLAVTDIRLDTFGHG